MLRLYCALISTLFLTAVAFAGAEPPAVGGRPAPGTEGGGLFQVIKHFDFNELPLGNFDDVPMYWRRLAGEGFPRYSAGRFDEEVGYGAPPSFVLEVQGGSVAYEYRDADLPVIPDADYFIVAYVRAADLHHAHAFLHAYLLDATGGHVPDSDRLTRLAASRDPADGDEPWQRLELTLSGDFPTATALRLGIYVLQDDAWDPPSPSSLDPIVRQEVDATVWFDDITVYQLPRVRLALSNPAGLVQPGDATYLVCDIRNASAGPLTTELRIVDADEQELHREQHDVPAQTATPFDVPLPELAAGLYEGQLYLRRDEITLLCRVVRFAVLPKLPPQPRAPADLGVDLGLWRQAGTEGACELIRELRCGAVKVGVPMIGELDTDSKVAYLDQIRGIFRALLADYVDVTGVLLPPEAAFKKAGARTTHQLLRATNGFDQHLAPVLAYLGGLVTTWQLGAEATDAVWADAWDASTFAALRGQLHRFVTAPELVLPHAAVAGPLTDLSSQTGGPRTVSIWVPPELPARSLPGQLTFLAGGPLGAGADRLGLAPLNMPEMWVMLARPRPELVPEQRVLDGARRLVLAKALGPERVFVPAPFEASAAGGGVAWQPTEEYIALRTLFHYIGGKRAVAAMPLPDQDGLAVVFSSESSSCVVLWTWRDQPTDDPVELYLGDAPVAVDLCGRRVPLEVRERRAQVRLSPEPVILDEIDAPLALLQASFQVQPAWIQLHQAEPRPVLRLRNYYAENLSGTLTFELPPDWRLTPRIVQFELAPGEELAHTLRLDLPPREIAMERLMRVRIELRSPVVDVLDLTAPLTVRLRDIHVQTRTQWDGGNLVVEQTLVNASATRVSFSAFCQPPGRAQVERTFLDVSPGESQTRRYLIRNARSLGGAVLRVGIREIQGPRSLDQLVEIPA